jgi:hypothetical protein
MLCFGYPTEKALKREYTTRFPQKYIHFKNTYKKIESADFTEMYKDKELKRYIDNATNFGQHMYLRKFSADFSVEMSRSVKKAIKEWCK